MNFELLGNLQRIEIIAQGREIRELRRLIRVYGKGRWRKLKGIGHVRIGGDTITVAEIHWYEAHGIGRMEMKIKRFVG